MNRFFAVAAAIALLVLLVWGGFHFARWRARELVDNKRAVGVTRLVCQGLQAYRQRTGQLPPSLDAIVDDDLIPASFLDNATNNCTVTYDPGSEAEQRMPRLTVSSGSTWIAVTGPDFEFR